MKNPVARKIRFLALIALSISLHAVAADKIPEGTLKRNIVTLDKEYRFYHWATEEKVLRISKSSTVNLEAVKTYVKKVINYRDEITVWDGLYLALDPIVSANYGNRDFNNNVRDHSEWTMTEFSFPKGTRFLNLYIVSDARGIYDGLLSSEEISWFQNRGCTIKTVNDFYTGRSFTPCSSALNDYIKLSGTDAVLYIWGRTQFSFFPGHQDPNQYAVILKNTGLMNKSKLSLFTGKNPMSPSKKEKIRVLNSLWKNNEPQPTYSIVKPNGEPRDVNENDSPVSFTKLSPAPKKTVERYAKDYFLGCDKSVVVHP